MFNNQSYNLGFLSCNSLKKSITVICELTKKSCIHADPRKADEGVYENCRLCEVYEEKYLKL